MNTPTKVAAVTGEDSKAAAVTGENSKVAAVTGGSAGIGKAICEQFLADGYEVISLARRRCDLAHPQLHSLEVDLLDRREHRTACVIHDDPPREQRAQTVELGNARHAHGLARLRIVRRLHSFVLPLRRVRQNWK